MVDIKVRVVNKLGKDVAQNGQEQGEIIVKGHGVPNDTLENDIQTYADGWLRTGDQGTIDEKGKIHIIKSNQNLFNNDGGKVSAFEIETILLEHPAIREIVLITTPDANLKEVLHAFVVLHDNYELTEQELIFFAEKHFSPSDCPKKVTFMHELPKTMSGKILKTHLGQ